jgi:DNA gyrase/topoisomerase IV subunit B
VIDAGYIYIAQPPLYKIKKGKEISYAYTDEEKIKIVGKDADVSEIQEVEAVTEGPKVEEPKEPEEEAEKKEIKQNSHSTL